MNGGQQNRWYYSSLKQTAVSEFFKDSIGMFPCEAPSPYGAETKVMPMRLSFSQTIWHSRTTAPSDITKRKRAGTKAGSWMSIAAPSGEMFRTTQFITEPPADT